MKSSFGRSFSTAAAILLVAMTILGASFQIKVNQFLTDTTVSGLQQNADTIAELAAAINNGGMYNRSFQLNLTVASQVSGADAVVCDSEGNVVLCSDAPSGCEHQGLPPIRRICKRSFERRRHRHRGHQRPVLRPPLHGLPPHSRGRERGGHRAGLHTGQ